MARVRQRKPALPALSPLAVAQTRQLGHAPLTLPPSTMTEEPAPRARPPGTRRAARRLRRRRVALIRERVCLHFFLTVKRGLRCGKANLNTPKFFTRFDPVFPRDSIGRSILFPIKEDPTSLATSSLSSKRANGNEPPRARILFSLALALLSKTPTGSTGPASSLGTLTYVHQATSAPVAQDRDPTPCNGPVVTPRSPARSAGRYSREDTPLVKQ